MLCSTLFFHVEIYGQTQNNITIYFIDQTKESWVRNDGAVMELVDNSSGHDSYPMTKIDDTVWSVSVPESAYNITFNRYSPDKSTRWNSWSAGGRDGKNAYCAGGSEYGHWDIKEEDGFQEGDTIYLDLSEFTEWKKDSAMMYVNFTDASKAENNNQDIEISTASRIQYAPVPLTDKVSDDIYSYTVTEENKNSNCLRFWRGNANKLWNYSEVLSYADYESGKNCIKITGWNDGELCFYDENPNITIDMSPFEYNEALEAYMCIEKMDTLTGAIEQTGSIKEFSYTVQDIKGNLILNGMIDVTKEWSINRFGLVYGYNEVIIKAVTKSGKVYTCCEKIWNTASENLSNINIDTGDTDQDGLDNYLESLYETDPKKADTDGDGLSDFYEVYALYTSPLKRDTDGNGIADGEEDGDLDGLTNLLEMQEGTNPMYEDTDRDGLLDAEELQQYGTKPLEADTDGDTLLDGSDVKLGYDPNKKDTDGDGIPDNKEILQQEYVYCAEDDDEEAVIKSIAINTACNGDLAEQVWIESCNEETVKGMVGKMFDISVDAEFETATVTFTYTEELLGSTKEEDLCVLWYDEEQDIYDILDDVCVVDTEKNTVTYETTHFSKYLLVDKQIWYDTWRENPNYRSHEEPVYYNVALTVDVSGSMEGSRLDMAKQTLHSFVNALVDEDYACLVSYSDSAVVNHEFTKGNDKETMYTAIDSLSAWGGTNISNGILEACRQLLKAPYGKENGEGKFVKNQGIIVLICDGQSICSETALQAAVVNNIKINCINVAQGSAAELQRIAGATGGEYYYAATSEDLITVMEQLQHSTVGKIDVTDTDGDGLYDVYEVNGMRIANGEVIYTDPNEADSDKDGIPDGEEMGELSTVDYDMCGETFSCTLFHNESDPNKKGSTLPNGWKYVDSMDYLPVSPDIYNCMYVDTVSDKYRDYIKGMNLYGHESLHGVLANTLTAKKYIALSADYYLWNSCFEETCFTNAGQFLHYYLGNRGGTHQFNAANIVYWGDIGKNYFKNIERIYKNRKKLVKKGETVYLACETDLSGRSLSGCKSYGENIGELILYWNQFLAINAASAGMVVELSFDGETYTANYHYYIIDYYNWDLNPVSLDELNLYGFANNFLNYGKYSSTLSWNKGDDVNAALYSEYRKALEGFY